LLIRRLAAPADVLLKLSSLFPQRYPVLFDSAALGPLSRYSILCAAPSSWLVLDSCHRIHGSGMQPAAPEFLNSLDAWWQAERNDVASKWPFVGGWVVYLGYELAREIEPGLQLPAANLPWHACALRIGTALIHDQLTDELVAIAEPSCISQWQRLCEDVAQHGGHPSSPDPNFVSFKVHEEPAETFLRAVTAAQQHISAGDIYQANLSRGWQVQFSAAPDTVGLYRQLRAANPAPFAGILQWQGVAILSTSPERLVGVATDGVSTRPIAGTRPRLAAADSESDQAVMRELQNHPKERAEHLMLLDLERNDLGKVCRAGSVQVDEYMAIESYAHVHHIVSNVRGQLRPEVTPAQVLSAVFPGGTITGCPKVRCMEIIAALERCGRGAYTGSLGYLNRNGFMDFNILIRTLTVQGMQAEFRAGGGIVADSIPERELEETRAKARGILTGLHGFGGLTTA
jgi:anthranilate synthase component I